MVGQVGIAGESPGNIAGAELVTLPLFPKVEQLVFVGRDFSSNRKFPYYIMLNKLLFSEFEDKDIDFPPHLL